MRRRDFIASLAGAAATALPVRAQNAVPLVAALWPGRPGGSGYFDHFFEEMRALGYVEGKNVRYATRWDGGIAAGLPALAAELVALKPKVIVVSGGRAIEAVRRATKIIPVVVPFTSELVGSGFATSLAHPEGNITGLSAMSGDLSAKRIELLKVALPGLARLAVIWNSPLGKDQRWGVIEATARTLAIALTPVGIRNAAALDEAFAGIAADRTDAIYVILDRFTSANRTRIVELAARHRLPAMYDFRSFPEAGGLMSYGPHIPDMYRRAAVFVDKILHGAKPADLPVEQPTKFQLVINLKTAKALGLALPPTLLALADEAIE
jgi:putative ABC transport system substrate-binding protein